VVIIPFVRNPVQIDHAVQAESEEQLHRCLQRASSAYHKMVQLEMAFQKLENQTRLKNHILPRVAQICNGLESRIIKGISVLTCHAMIVSFDMYHRQM